MAVIFHVDINAFFAICEIRKDKSLIDKPLVVSRTDAFYKSIILSPSYEARKYGIKTTMSLKEAYKLCPQLVVKNPDMRYYAEVSELFFSYLESISPNVEPMSIDEGFVDVTNVKMHPLKLAEKIQNELLTNLQIPVNIGIAPNKFLAKMASDYQKPFKINVFRKREISKFLWPQPIKNMLGIGKKMEKKLHSLNILTIGDLANYKDLDKLKCAVGEKIALAIFQNANGEGSTVLNATTVKNNQISRTHTFSTNVFDDELLRKTLKVLLKSVVSELEYKHLGAKTAGVIFKFGNFRALNRSKPLTEATDDFDEIFEKILEIYYEVKADDDEIRAIGVFVSRISDIKAFTKQLSLFDDFEEMSLEQKIYKTINKINKAYDKDLIKLGVNIDGRKNSKLSRFKKD